MKSLNHLPVSVGSLIVRTNYMLKIRNINPNFHICYFGGKII